MTLRQAWKWSKTPYSELVFRSSRLISSPGGSDEEAQKRIKSTIRQSRTSKFVYTFFICLGAGIPFAQYVADPMPVSLVSAIALSLMLSFAYLVIYALLILPSFADSEAYSLLSTLPLRGTDSSRIAMFSFVRTFDYLAVSSIIVPVSAVAILTLSPMATLLMFCSAVMNCTLAVFTGLWLARMFYRTISRGGRSTRAAITRTVFIIAWGVAVMSVGLAFNSVFTFLPYINHVLSGDFSPALGVILSLLHPFTFGMVISSLAFQGLYASGGFGSGSALFTIVSYAATGGYALIAYMAATRALHAISDVSKGHGVVIEREVAREFTLRLRSPAVSYMLKDLRIAVKSPSTALILAFPVFEIFVILVTFFDLPALRAPDIVIMTLMTAAFSLVAGHLLLEAERKGLDYTLSLPLGRHLVVTSKSFIATLVFIPAPFAILLLQLAKTGSLSAYCLIPFIEILALSAATTSEIAMMVTGGRRAEGYAGEGKSDSPRRNIRSTSLQLTSFSIVSGSNMGKVLIAVIAAVFLLVLPVAAYFICLAFSHTEWISFVVMAVAAGLELLVVQLLLRHNQ